MGYFPRLVRDGWKWTSRSAELDVFEKPLSRRLTLRKMFHCVWNSKSCVEGRRVYWESHEISDADGNVVVDGANWSWADFDKPRKHDRLCDYPNKDAMLAAEPGEVGVDVVGG